MTAATLFDLPTPQISRRGSRAASKTSRQTVPPATPRTLIDTAAVVASGSLLPAGDERLDADRMRRLLDAIAPGSNGALTLTIPGRPATKTRARHGQRRTFKTKEDVAAEKRTAGFIRTLFPAPWTGNVALACVFFRHDKQLIDTDNMLKHICDAANGIAYVDDSQATAVYGVTELDIANPRTVLVFAHHRSSLTRGSDDVLVCTRCGGTFLAAGKPVKFCSEACRYPNRVARP